MESEKTVLVEYPLLLEFTKECFIQSGFSIDTANLISKSLLEADLRGLNTHGVLRIPMYLNRVKLGLINPKAEISIILDKNNIAIIDAGNGMGQPASVYAMQIAVKKASQSIIGAVGVRNSNHFGTAAYYSKIAAENNMIGISMSNTEPLMPAPGGRKAVVGNNPLSTAIPLKDREPIILDMATSTAAIGKILIAQKRGDSIPVGWAVDKLGKDTTNPFEALNGGLIMPLGGPKGYGLSIIIDVLAGILTGSGFGQLVKSPFEDMANDQRAGHFFIAIDIKSFIALDDYYENTNKLVNEIKSSPTIEGVEEVMLPGEIEYRTMQSRLNYGIPLPIMVIRDLEQLALSLGVDKIKLLSL